MNEIKTVYMGRDLVLIIPTKDRPIKILSLLDSIAIQTVQCGRVIIVDGGRSIKDIVNGYRNCLTVEYYRCWPPGQIRQRNMGIAQLNNRNLLIGFIDDDMVFEPDAIEKMIDFWNRTEAKTAGVGFNIVNASPHRHSFILGLFLASSHIQGSILRSGHNVTISNISEDIHTQWLGGGYTVWRHEILENFSQKNLNTRYAAGEDVRFSYPIGKQYPLYVCAGARIRHEHDYDQVPNKAFHRYQGLKLSIGNFCFAESYQEISCVACLWMLTGMALSGFVSGCVTFSRRRLEFSLGQAKAIVLFLKSILGDTDMFAELED